MVCCPCAQTSGVRTQKGDKWAALLYLRLPSLSDKLNNTQHAPALGLVARVLLERKATQHVPSPNASTLRCVLADKHVLQRGRVASTCALPACSALAEDISDKHAALNVRLASPARLSHTMLAPRLQSRDSGVTARPCGVAPGPCAPASLAHRGWAS